MSRRNDLPADGPRTSAATAVLPTPNPAASQASDRRRVDTDDAAGAAVLPPGAAAARASSLGRGGEGPGALPARAESRPAGRSRRRRARGGCSLADRPDPSAASRASAEAALRTAWALDLHRRPAAWLGRWAGSRRTPLLRASAARTLDGAALLDALSDRRVAESSPPSGPVAIVRLPDRWTAAAEDVLARCLAASPPRSSGGLLLLSTQRVHFGDRHAERAERGAASCAARAGFAGSVLRLGKVIDDDLARSAAPWQPALPASLRSCWLTVQELEETLDRLAADPPQRPRTLTVLGANLSVREVLRSAGESPPCRGAVAGLARVLGAVQAGRLAAALLRAGAAWRPAWREWFCTTLEPRTRDEVLSLYNPLNRRHVVLAGYNTGVTHFGWKFPGRTVVRTTGCHERLRVVGDALQADAGATIKLARERLEASGKSLVVRPNYSYVALGSSFFVPIHGSGSEAAALGDALEQVVLYLPDSDEFLRLRRGDPEFAARMYAPADGALLLRLRMRIQDARRYAAERRVLESPTAAEAWAELQDREACNVELRKARAEGDRVTVHKYYPASEADAASVAEAADAVGRTWDRIESVPPLAWLFHWLVRTWGYHVELFLNREEFAVFWRRHGQLPIAKLQFRPARCDGMPHSPFGDEDRVAVDMFMRRGRQAALQHFVTEHLPHARYNRGKHSL